MSTLTHKTVVLESGISGATEEIKCKFSDLEETIKMLGNKLGWVKTIEITEIPVYIDPDIEYAVCKYVFNKFEIWEKERDNRLYEKMIFGE